MKHGLMRNTVTCLAKAFRAGSFFTHRHRQGFRNRDAVNHGAVTTAEEGDPFTDPRVYRNNTNASIAAKLPHRVAELREHQRLNATLDRSIGDKTILEGEKQGGPSTSVSASINARDLGLNVDKKFLDQQGSRSRGRDGADFTRAARDALRRDEVRQEEMIMKHGQTPTAKEYARLLRQLSNEDADAQRIEEYQARLADEHGIYAPDRMDAYMLDDESIFPEWVRALPHSIRDRVKFGNMGITEDDDAMRVRLGRLSADQREREWKRIRSAKSYKAAEEEMISATELRDLRRGKRRFHWLVRKRQERASAIRRLALRRPERFDAWPTDSIDYSRRLSVIAQHVENGVATQGQWPLDEVSLAQAKLRKRQEDAERTFMKTEEERRLARKTNGGRYGHVSGNVGEVLKQMDSRREERPIAKLSRKAYANRINAVKHGDRDEHGRNYHVMHKQMKGRQRAFQSMAELSLSKEVRKEPTPERRGKAHGDRQHWSQHSQETTYSSGLPSMFYGE